MEILREHFNGGSRNKVYTLVTELCYNRKRPEESVTSFLMRAETTYDATRKIESTLPDFIRDVVVGSVLNALSHDENYKTFCQIFTQSDKNRSFSDLKENLKIYDQGLRGGEHVNPPSIDNSVMKVNDNIILCFTCSKPGHKSSQCRNKGSKNR